MGIPSCSCIKISRDFFAINVTRHSKFQKIRFGSCNVIHYKQNVFTNKYMYIRFIQARSWRDGKNDGFNCFICLSFEFAMIQPSDLGRYNYSEENSFTGNSWFRNRRLSSSSIYTQDFHTIGRITLII